METKHRIQKRLGALDVFIILALLAVSAGVGLRAYMNRNADIGASAVLEDYIISFEVKDIRDSSNARHMNPGDKFYLKDTGAYFGELTEENTVTPAETLYEMPDGSIISAPNSGTGDNYRVDVHTSVTAQGTISGDGSFLLGGNTYIGLNKELQIYSKYLAITVKITGISKSR